MNIAEIITNDCANGPGIRLSLFVSGCTNRCEGCFQPQTWNFDYGMPYSKDIEDEIIEELHLPQYKGITILGGEPFEPSNQEGLIALIRRIKSELPSLSIWMFTGFTYEKDLIEGGRKYTPFTDEILESIEVLVDGKFELSKRNLMLNFRGSENQRIIDMEKTLAEGRVSLSPLN